jgi:hypothetical protein
MCHYRFRYCPRFTVCYRVKCFIETVKGTQDCRYWYCV